MFRAHQPDEDLEIRTNDPLTLAAVRMPDVRQLDPIAEQDTRAPRNPSQVGLDRKGWGLLDRMVPTLNGEHVEMSAVASADPLQQMLDDGVLTNTFRIQPDPWDQSIIIEGSGV